MRLFILAAIRRRIFIFGHYFSFTLLFRPKIKGAIILLLPRLFILCAIFIFCPRRVLIFEPLRPPLCSGRFALKNNHAINRSIVSVVTLQELFSCLGILYLFLPVGFCFCVFSLGKNKNKIINRRRILLFSAILFFIGEFCFG